MKSNRGEGRIPILLQLKSDADFLMALEDRADSSQCGQGGFTDPSDSRSDIDISALIQHPDQNLPPIPHGFGHLLSHRLDLEGLGVVSSSVHMFHNIPPPSQLKEEARIQEEVQHRLRHLADNVKPGTYK